MSDSVKREGTEADLCTVCDEDGLIYAVEAYDEQGRAVERAQTCPACEGTRNGPLARRCIAAELELDRCQNLLCAAEDRADQLDEIVGNTESYVRKSGLLGLMSPLLLAQWDTRCAKPSEKNISTASQRIESIRAKQNVTGPLSAGESGTGLVTIEPRNFRRMPPRDSEEADVVAEYPDAYLSELSRLRARCERAEDLLRKARDSVLYCSTVVPGDLELLRRIDDHLSEKSGLSENAPAEGQCRRCLGTGEIVDWEGQPEECLGCGGSGRLKEPR